MDAGNEGDDARVQQGDEQPRTKRKLSRLSHMAVNKPAGGDQELHHKSSAAAAGFGSAAKARESGERRDSDLADASDDAIADPDTLSPAAGPSLRHRATQGSIQNAAVIAATEPADALQSEPPIVAAKGHPQPSQQQHPSETAAGTAASTAAQEASNQPHRVNLDDEEDDEWEDQPAPLVIQAADGGFEGSAEGRGAEADIQQQEADEAAATAAEYDPSSRRRAVYDDEDEWEDLVMKEKVKGSQAGSVAQDEAEDEQQESASHSGSGQEDEDSILAEDPDETNAATQRLLRDSALRDGLGKGFKPEVVPLNSLLCKLAARQAALEAKAKQRASAAEQHRQPAITLEQLKAHLELHSIGSNQQGKQQGAQRQSAAEAPEATHVAEEGLQQVDLDVGCDNDIDDGLDDELMIEPAQQPAAAGVAAAADMLPPDTQQLFGELPPLHQHQTPTSSVVAGTELCTGTAAELQLQLEDDMNESGSDGGADDSSKGSQGDADMAESSEEAEEGSDDDEDAVGSGSEEHEDLLDSSEIDASEAEAEGSQQEQSEELAEPEPLHWEEEDEDAVGPSSSSQQGGAAAPGGAAGDARKSSKGSNGAKPRCQGAAGGFVEAEADLSDDEGHEDDGESDDGDDAMLAELIAEVKEGRMDESRRADLHAKWMAGKDAKEMKDLLEALKRGFKRKRKAGAGLDDDEDDGTDAAARRRRAQLLGTLDEEGDEEGEAVPGTDRLKRLDFQWHEEEGEIQAAAAALAAELANREKHKKIQHLQLQASESQDGDDVMQLLQMDMVDEDSQHTAALLSKAASAPAAAVAARQGSDLLQPTLQLAGHSMPAQSRLAGSKLKQQTGPGKQPAPAVDAAAPGGGASSKAGGSAGGFSFQVFGKDLTNSNKQQKSKQQQVAGSFIGRQASTSTTVRAASNYGASRSFVFGSDPSNYSNPAAKEQQDDGTAAVGPSSFAGLSKLIAEGAPPGSGAAAGSSWLGPAGAASGGQDSSLLQMLGGKKGSGSAAAGSSKLHMDAVGTKFKAVGNSRPGGDSNAATSRGGAWQF